MSTEAGSPRAVSGRQSGATAGGWPPLLTAAGLTAFGHLLDRRRGAGHRLPVHAAAGRATCRRSTRRTCAAVGLHICRSRMRSSSSGSPLGFRAHLLLLPQGVLPLVLPRAAGVCGRRPAAPPLPRRDEVPVRAAEPPPVLPLPGADRARVPLVRHRPRVPVPRPDGSLHFGVGARVAGHARRTSIFLSAVHVRLQLAAPPDRRQARLLHVLALGARRATSSGAASASSTAGTCSGPGSACRWSGSPTSTSGSPRPACSTTRGSSDVTPTMPSSTTSTTSW